MSWPCSTFYYALGGLLIALIRSTRTAGEDETMDFQNVLGGFNWEDLYPLNKSLGQDMRRLFQSIEMQIPQKFPGYDDCIDLQAKFHLPQCLQGDVVSDDFRLNGVEVADLAPKEQRPRTIIKVTQDRRLRGECVFCRNNGESVDFYASHLLKDRNGRVTCPILRAYVCPMCGTSGDDSHTIRYCPLNKMKNETASIVQLKKMRKSVGVR